MAKLLKIGAAYAPNYKVTLSDGTKKVEPYVLFFFDSDPRTADIVAGSNVAKNLRTDGDSVVKAIKVDKYKDFIYGQKMLPRILAEFEKYGYLYDTSKLNSLEASVEQEIQNVLSNDASSKIYADNSSFIDDIIKAMEENLNDPKFLSYVNAVGSIQYVGDDVLSKVTKLSYKNTCMVLSQWVNSGHGGQPTYLATKRQWSKFFNRDIIPGATPLYIVNPKDVTHRSLNQTMRDYGVSQAQYDSNPMIRKQIDTLTNDKEYGQYVNHEFGLNGLSPYYDYSETVLQAGAQSNYDFDNIGTGNIDKDKDKAEDEKRGDILAAATNSDSRKSEADIIKSLEEYAVKNNNTDLINILKSGNNVIVKAVEYLAENSKTILREVDAKKKNLYRGVLVAFVLKRIHVDTDYSDRLLMNNMSQLRDYGGLNKKVFYAVGADFENIVSIIYGLNESVSNSTIMWMLNTLGMSVEEFKALPNNEEEAETMVSKVRESFIKTFNNLLK
jgi:hypothetical protein